MYLSYSYNSSQLQIGVLSPFPLQIPLARALRAARICLCVLCGRGVEWGAWAGRRMRVDSKALSSTCNGRLSPRHSPEQTTRRILAPCSDSLSVRKMTHLRLRYSHLVGSLV